MNWNGKYVSIQNIISTVYRNMKVSQSLNIVDAVEWAGEAIEFIGGPYTFEQKVVVLPIVNFKAKLPCELHYIETTRGYPIKNTNEECYSSHKAIPMRYSTDSFHHRFCAGNADCRCSSSYTYTVNDDYINTSFREGFVELSFQAIPIDNEGFPKIADTIKIKQAVAAHISWRIASIQADEGKMPQWRYEKYELERDWYIGAAQTSQQMPSIDMMESIKNNWLRLIPKINQHSDSFKSAGDPEKRYIHNATNSGYLYNNRDSNNTNFLH